MSGISEIKTRMKSVQDTKKITNAMYLISSTKMKKAKAGLDKSMPHFNAIRNEIKRIFRTAKNIESKYFYPEDMSEFKNGTYGILVITADKGLAGAYNLNVIKETEKLLNDHDDCKLFVVGEYGRQYFKRHNIEIEENFYYSADEPTFEEARKVTANLLEKYDSGELKKIFVVYTNLKNGLLEEAVSARLLPFHRDYFNDEKKEKEVYNHFDFYPSAEAVLDSIMDSYIAGFVYGALVDSFSSEQNARMNAMSSANKNADELLDKLKLAYNKLRQSEITREITEISAGAKAYKLR